MDEQKRTLTVRVQSHEAFMDDLMRKAQAIDRGEGYQGEVLSFTEPALMSRVFSEKRWALIQKLRVIGPSTLRGLARELGRDVKRVYEDVELLIEDNVIERTADGKLVVPFETIRIEAELQISQKPAAA